VFDRQQWKLRVEIFGKAFLISDVPRNAENALQPKQQENSEVTYTVTHCQVLSALSIPQTQLCREAFRWREFGNYVNFHEITKSKPVPELGVAHGSMLQLKTILGLVEILVIVPALEANTGEDNSVTEL